MEGKQKSSRFWLFLVKLTQSILDKAFKRELVK